MRSGTHTPSPSRGRAKSSRAAGARGFTLVELIAVLIILAIAASVALPRFIGNAERQAQIEADQVRALVAQAASQLARPGIEGGRPIAIEQIGERRLLQIVERESAERGGAWRPQRLSPSVTLSRLEVRQALADDSPLDVRAEGNWRIELSSASAPPRLSLLLAGSSVPSVWQVDMDPESWRVRLRQMPEGTRSIVPTEPGSVNLDGQGGADLPW
ncbi:MAG: type II secretion system protein [Phycisphaeraceae bacterium]|nr:type II secretion system protein [Phycisphaeraceae bacterium]